MVSLSFQFICESFSDSPNPVPDRLTVCWSMVTVATFEAESGLAGDTNTLFSNALLSLDYNITIWPRTEPQVGMTPDIVNEREVNVSLSYSWICHVS